MSELAATEAPAEVRMIADLACPWCYIGLKRLQRARALRPGRPVRLLWWPFLLNPFLPPEGMDRAAYVRGKFGGEAAAERVYRRIADAGRDDGIDFRLERMPRTPNTVRAQALVLGAQRQGAGERVAERLFEKLFVDGEDLGDARVLLDAAQECGIDPAAAQPWLESARAAEEVGRGHEQAERLGVRGVPVYVVAGRHAISGAQPPEVLAGLLDMAPAGEQAAPVA